MTSAPKGVTNLPAVISRPLSGPVLIHPWTYICVMYIQPWIKTGPESGLEITAGKFVTPFGAEVIDATGNALFSHSYLFNYAIPFAHTGVKLNYIFNPQVSVYVGAIEGWDVFENNNDAWSTMAGGAINSTEQTRRPRPGDAGLESHRGPGAGRQRQPPADGL